MSTATTTTNQDDREESLIPTRWSLIGRLKNWDDQESWSEFFETYWRLIYGVALKSGLRHSEAEDVVQETVVSVCRKMGEFRASPEHGSFKCWLLQLTRWRITDQFRKRRDRKGAVPQETELSANEEGSEEAAALATSNLLEAIWDEEWEQHLIKAALEKLKPQVSARQFQIFYLHVIKRMSPSDTARALRVRVPLVHLTKHRVKPKFEQALKAVENNL